MNKLCLYIKRVITRTGPHGKNCGCNKWGHYVGLGCPHPLYKLKAEGQVGMEDANYDPSSKLIIYGDNTNVGIDGSGPKEELHIEKIYIDSHINYGIGLPTPKEKLKV